MTTSDKTTGEEFSVDGSVRGFLTRLGDSLDAFTGRSWKPAGGLTTSHLAEQLKVLVDSRVRDLGRLGKLAPNSLRIKIDWQRFSADSDSFITKLEEDLLVAVVDHYNDRRYHTLAPLALKIKTDYFTDGVTLSATFPFEGTSDGEIELELPADLKARPAEIQGGEVAVPETRNHEIGMFHLSLSQRSPELGESRHDLPIGQRISIGRSAANDIVIEDPSVSSAHASAMFTPGQGLMIADLGSTNGTFLGRDRMEEGAGIVIESGTEIRFGSVVMVIEYDSIHSTSAGGSE